MNTNKKEDIPALNPFRTFKSHSYTGNAKRLGFEEVESFGIKVFSCPPAVGVTDFSGLFTTFTELSSATGSATATVACFDFTSVTIDPSHTARVAGTVISGNELLLMQGVGTNPNANLARVIIKSNDNSKFSFKSIKVQPFGSFTNWDITYQGYKDGSAVTGANLNRNSMISGTMYTDNFSSISGFSNVDEIRIEFSVIGTVYQNFRMDDIEIGPASSNLSPSLTTTTTTGIGNNEAVLNGNIISDGGSPVTSRGFVYSNTDNTPTLGEGGVTNVIVGDGTGTFQKTITGLSAATTYYYQAYAINAVGISYGGVESFETELDCSTPPDQDFGDYENLDYGASLTYQCITYTGSDALVGIGNAVSQAITSSPLFSGSAVVMISDSPGGYVSFKSTQSSNNFRIVSFVAEFFGHSNGEVSEVYSIKGFDNGIEVVSVTGFEVRTSGNYGIGNATIGYAREDFDEYGSNSGLLTFGTGWNNVDELRFYTEEAAPYNNIYVALDNINFEPAEIVISSPIVNTDAATGIEINEAVLAGNIASDGGSPVTSRGFVYSTTDNTPTLGEVGVTNVTAGDGTGTFQETITGLSIGTTYYYQAYATNAEGSSYGGVESFETLADTEPPVVILPTNSVRTTDLDECGYNIIGTEFDPVSITDNNEGIASITYSLHKLLPSPNLVSESFEGETWNDANFQVGSDGGRIVNGAYQSGDAVNSRDILYTVNDFQPTESNPVYVTAKLTFNIGGQIAFMGTRGSGLRNPGNSNEPANSLYLRIHNFIDGYTGITHTSFNGRPGNQFYQSPVLIELIDNGINISGKITNIQSGQVLNFNENTSYSSGSWKVLFSGGAGVAWDDIKISFGPHEYFQEYSAGENTLDNEVLGVGETIIFWTAEDLAGNQTTESFHVTVEDNQKPYATAIERISGQSENSVNWETDVPEVVFGDNCSSALLNWQMSGAVSASGNGQVGTYIFPPGFTLITYTITDAWGNFITATTEVENTKKFFAAGSGTESDPYQIEDWEHLFNIRFFNNSYFVLNNDLDKNSTGYSVYASETSNNGEGWLPSNYQFGLHFNGEMHTISDLYIKRPNQWQVGLFGFIQDSEFKNLKLNEFNVEGGWISGCLTAYATLSTFDKIEVTNSKLGLNGYYGGLLVGIASEKINISNSSFSGEVTGDYYLGGIAGYLFDGSISSSYTDVRITGVESLGGLVAYCENYNQNNLISQSFAKGEIIGESIIGGISGQSYNLQIEDVYSQVDLHASGNNVGGIIGYNYNSQIKNVYVIGKMNLDSTSDVGPIVGSMSGADVINSFWDIETTGLDESDFGGEGLITNEMKSKVTFSDSNWDFENIWSIKEPLVDQGYISYPYFKSISYDDFDLEIEVNPIPGLELSILPQTINFPEIDNKTYGDLPFILGDVQTDKGLTITYLAEDPTIVNILGNEATILKAGVTKITASQSGDENFGPAEPIERDLEVTKALVTITAEDKTKVYGTINPTLTISYDGLVNGDTKVATEPSISTTALVSSGVGTYPITLTGG
ncbi:hypothetical protein MM239_16480, partial [Belliella sp. DSM 111904]